MQSQSIQNWQQAERLLQARRHAEAGAAYTSLLDDPTLAPMAHLRLSLLASADGRRRDAIAHARSAWEKRTPDPDLLDMVGKRLFSLGELELAVACATSPELQASRNPVLFAELGKLLSDAALPAQALQLLRGARERGLDSAALRYLLGLSEFYLGNPEAAEAELEEALRQDPTFAHAAWSLAKLRTQTDAHNHVDRLRASAAATPDGTPESALLHYALFKELDDLGRTDEAWSALEAGMRERRRLVRYDQAAAEALFQHLGDMQAGPAAEPAGDAATPIFIVGMPRTGTTLLERILGAHSQVADAGELHDFTWAMRWACDRGGPPGLDLDLARRMEQADPAEVGARYLDQVRWRTGGKRFFTDKMPTNFLNVGYILRALPHARILHMSRGAMDTCFSNLKEYFAGPYPHSYDQAEMADHYRHYRQLMAHWHALHPGRILDVRYDALTADPEGVAREVLAFCGLPWEEGLVAIERRDGAVPTASAAQVREPIHGRFRERWRAYAAHLGPLRERLGSDAD